MNEAIEGFNVSQWDWNSRARKWLLQKYNQRECFPYEIQRNIFKTESVVRLILSYVV